MGMAITFLVAKIVTITGQILIANNKLYSILMQYQCYNNCQYRVS